MSHCEPDLWRRADHISRDLELLRDAIRCRFSNRSDRLRKEPNSGQPPGEAIQGVAAWSHPCSSDEHLIQVLAFAPHIQPDFFSRLIAECVPEGGDLPEFGGVRAENHRGVLPTGETAQFVLAGDDLTKRLAVQRMLSSDHQLAREHIVWVAPVREGEPVMSGRLILNPEIVEVLTTGTVSRPRFSTEFPAEHIDTAMDWDVLVLHPNTLK